MHGHQLGAVREGRLDLNIMDHLGNALHHLGAGQHTCPLRHQRRNTLAVARALDHVIGNQRDRLGIVELDATLQR